MKGLKSERRIIIKHHPLNFDQGFYPIFDNARGQAAEMVITPGKSEGGPDNAHQGADQWLFVVSVLIFTQ